MHPLARRQWLRDNVRVMQSCPPTLICPICRAALAAAERTLRCPSGHSFDLARAGYVNLLTGKPSRFPGDSKLMLAARRRFLEGGHYAALATAVAHTTLSHLDDYANGAPHILDAGCGEGYYIGQLAAALGEQRPGRTHCFTGVDLSKEAARMAARRYPFAQFAVADTWRLVPVETGATAVVLNLFAPRNPAEFARVLAPGGLLLVVIPRPGHLQSVRDRFGLLSIETDKREQVIGQMQADFALAKAETLDVALRLNATAVVDLIQMTPSARHVGETVVGETAVVETVAQVELLSFVRKTG